MADEPSYPYAFFEGNLKPIEDAKISIMTNAFQYGNAVFGGIRGYKSDDGSTFIFRLHDHYKRFLQSLRILNKTIPYTADQLCEITLNLAKKNKPDTDSYFRPIAYAKNTGLSPDLSKVEFDFAMYMISLGEYLPLSKGLKVGISSWVRISDNMIPSRGKVSGGYINSSLAKADAIANGHDESLMMTTDGHISEASSSNFFMIRDRVLITPAKYSDVLEGITRRSILQLAHDLKIPVEERFIDRSEAYLADEAFLSGTGAQVAWISSIDHRPISSEIGPISKKIKDLFFNIVRGKEKKYSSWLTQV